MNEDIITTEDYAKQSHTDIQFINQLYKYGLIEIIIQEQTQYISYRQLPLVEKFTRLRYDLDINLEGIEAISHLLQRVDTMQQEMENLRRTLRFYEPELVK